MPANLGEIVSRATVFEDRDTWLLGRSNSIGASEIAAVFGCSRFASSYSLWQTKKLGLAPELDGEWLEWGQFLEPAIARGYSDKTGLKLVDLGRFTVLRHDNGILSCTLDYLIESSVRGLGVLQIKNASVGVARAFRKGCPFDYELQTRQEMLCARADWGVLAVLIGGNKLSCFEFDRDAELDEAIVDESTEWWKRYVLGEEVPDIDESEATLDALKHRFAEIESNEGTILPATAATLWREQTRLEAEAKVIDAKLCAIESRFRLNLGPFGWGVIPGVGKIARPSGPRGRWSVPDVAEPEFAAKLTRQIKQTRDKPAT